jgi:hypothetical protein
MPITVVGTYTGVEGDWVTRIVGDGTFLYTALRTHGPPAVPDPFTAVVQKINATTMIETARWIGGVGDEEASGLVHDGTFVYVSLRTSPVRVIKINPVTMMEVDRWVGGANDQRGFTMGKDGTWIYVGLYSAGGIIPPALVQLNPATMLENARWTGNAASERGITAFVYDGTRIYAGTAGRGLPLIASKVIQINPATMAEINRYDNPIAGYWLASDLAYDGTHIYLAIQDSLFQIETVAMTLVAAYTGVNNAHGTVSQGGMYLGQAEPGG